MYVRKITENERARAEEIFYIAFEQKMPGKDLSDLRTKTKPRAELYRNEKWAAFDENQTMMGFLSAIPYVIQFDGNPCSMVGIGDVSCLPQYRQKGVIRRCFQTSFQSMFQQGAVFSYLYPFSTEYYRKFGYTLCSEKIFYTIPMSALKQLDRSGEIYLAEQGEFLQDIQKVYYNFTQGYNLAVIRDESDYSWAVNSCPARDNHYIYLYKNKSGDAKGVMAFRKTKSGNITEMNCDQFFFSDMEGLKGLLSNLLKFQAYYDRVIFSLPADVNIISCIPEWILHPCSREICFNGMVRVINVKKVLETARYLKSGSIVIKINDALLEQNNHCFEIIFEAGKAQQVLVCQKEPDVELGIDDFSRCIVGGCSPEEISELETVRIHTDIEKIGKIFYKKHNFIADCF